MGLLFLFWTLGFTFIDKSHIFWLTKTYLNKFLPGPATLPFINLNAFNFWGLILGLERIKDNTIFLGLSLSLWAWFFAIVFFLTILVKFWRDGDIFFASLMMFFAAFMFLPRVHERYLYPIFVFFPLVLIKYPKLTKIFLALSFTFLVNLYHWWWFPKISFLVYLLDFEIFERFFSFINFAIFFYLFKIYLKAKV